MEVGFGQEAYGSHFDGFMRHYLTVKTGEIPRIDDVYDAFKAYARKPETAEAGVEALVREVRDHARYYCAMALGAEKDKDLGEAFHDLRELKVDTAYPFLLELYRDYADERLSRDRSPGSGSTDRGLCLPPRGLRHPDQLDEQDFRHLRACTEEGSLP